MTQSNQILLKKKYRFSNQQLSDPELNDLEKKLTDEEEPPEDIPYEEDLPEDSERRNNMPEKTIPSKDSQSTKEVPEFTRNKDLLNKKFPTIKSNYLLNLDTL